MAVGPIASGLYLGRGHDLAGGINYGEALEFGAAQPIIDSGVGQQVAFELRQITTSEELISSLNLTATASFAGVFNASAEAKYAAQQQINRYNTYLLVSVRVTNPELVIRSPRLKQETFQLLQERGWETFEQQYGPDYLAGLITGGSYYGLIEISTQSKTEQQEVAAAISASYGIFKSTGTLDGKLQQAIENKELKIKILQSGGSSDPLEVSLEDMIEQAKNFPTMALQHPVPFLGIYEEYSKTVPLPPAIGDGPLSRFHRQNVLEELGHRYLSYKDYRANLGFVLQNMLRFPEYLSLTDTELSTKRDRLQEDFQKITEQMNQLERQARMCRDSAQACELPTSYYVPIEPLPTLDGENMQLKTMEEELNKLKLQVKKLQELENTMKISKGSVGIGTANPKSKLHVTQDLVLGNDTNAQKFILHSRSNGRGEFLHITSDLANGNWAWNEGVVLRRGGWVGINTATPKGALDVNGDLKIKGEQPIHIRQFNGNKVNTKYSTKDWVATIAGFRALDGDIREGATGDVIQVYTYAENGTWWYFADFHSHNRHEKFTVWVMFMRRELVSA